MRIYALADQIILECEYCKARAELPAKESKRKFMLPLNKFAREHDNRCRWTHKRELQIKAARDGADRIFKGMVQSCR